MLPQLTPQTSFFGTFQGAFLGTFQGASRCGSYGKLRATPDGIGLCEASGNLEGTGNVCLLAKISLDPPRST